MAKKGKAQRDPNYRVVFKGINKLVRQFAKLMRKRNVAQQGTVQLLAKIRETRRRQSRKADRRSKRG